MPPFSFMLCADDYAIAPGVSRGILEAIAAGRLTATSAMTNMPSWPSAARGLAGFAGRADVGVHLNLTCGAPLGSMPGFARGGAFPKIGAVVAGALFGRLPEVEIRAEITRQIDAFVEAMGRPPDFIDGHQHVQVLRGVRRWLMEDMVRRGWAGEVWLRDSGDRWSALLARRVEAFKAAEIATLSLGFAAMAGSMGMGVNRGFSGFSSFDDRRCYAVDFATYLSAPGRRHLVMCHPGHADPELAKLGEIEESRQSELAFLLSDGFSAVLKARGARLARWNGFA